MLSKNQIKFINSLKLRKYRKRHSLFLAEGEKIVFDLINFGLMPQMIITSSVKNNKDEYGDGVELIFTKKNEIAKLSSLKTPADIIGIFKIKESKLEIESLTKELVIFCDDIQNPGNMGTIIRTADWFGIKTILCSKNTADIYNPKVVQASMGSVASVDIHYVNSVEFFNEIKGKTPVYGTFPEGDNIYQAELSPYGIIVMGNEGKGISDDLKIFIDKKIMIPKDENQKCAAESLNVSIATGIICSEFLRRQ